MKKLRYKKKMGLNKEWKLFLALGNAMFNLMPLNWLILQNNF